MDLYETLRADHRRFDTLFEALLDSVHRNDAEAAQAAWTQLDHGLASHLEAEEAYMLPLFDRFDPAEAAAIRGEHGKIREQMAALGVLLDLHALREEKVTELVGFLQAHAAREEVKLYPWATRELPEAPRQFLFQRLRDRHRGPRAWPSADGASAAVR
jgi:hypothetical protein